MSGGLGRIASETGVGSVVGLPNASSTSTVTAGEIVAPTSVRVGCCANVRWSGAAGSTWRSAVSVNPSNDAVTTCGPAAVAVQRRGPQLPSGAIDSDATPVSVPRRLPNASKPRTRYAWGCPAATVAAPGVRRMLSSAPGSTWIGVWVWAVPFVAVTVCDPATVPVHEFATHVPFVISKAVDEVTSPRGLPNRSVPEAVNVTDPPAVIVVALGITSSSATAGSAPTVTVALPVTPVRTVSRTSIDWAPDVRRVRPVKVFVP